MIDGETSEFQQEQNTLMSSLRGCISILIKPHLVDWVPWANVMQIWNCNKVCVVTPPFIRVTPLFTRPYKPLGLVSRCSAILQHLLTWTPLWTFETLCRSTVEDVTSTWWEQAAQSGRTPENVGAPESCTFRGSVAASGLKQWRTDGYCNLSFNFHWKRFCCLYFSVSNFSVSSFCHQYISTVNKFIIS